MFPARAGLEIPEPAALSAPAARRGAHSAVNRCGIPVLGGPGAGGRAGGRNVAQLLLRRQGLVRDFLHRQGCLDAPEQPFQPAHQLGLGHPQLGFGGSGIGWEGQADPVQFPGQFRGDSVLNLENGLLIDARQPVPRTLIQGSIAHLLQQLPDRPADPDDFSGLIHRHAAPSRL